MQQVTITLPQTTTLAGTREVINALTAVGGSVTAEANIETNEVIVTFDPVDGFNVGGVVSWVGYGHTFDANA